MLCTGACTTPQCTAAPGNFIVPISFVRVAHIIVDPGLPEPGAAAVKQWSTILAEAEEDLAETATETGQSDTLLCIIMCMAMMAACPEIRIAKMQSGDIRCTTRVLGRSYTRISISIDILHNAIAVEAIYDSTDSFMEPKCHAETRTEMLMDLRKWALDPHPKTTILWLYGPAGAGKSAIMRTLAAQLHEDRRLGGCFFFKRGHITRNNARTLFTTIAYQLALNVESLRTPISRVAEKDPSIVGLSIGTQMQQLISEPCRAHENRQSLAIVIDGLDECNGRAFQGEILRAILNPSSNHAIFLRFIVASRPEPQISKMFPLPDHSCSYRRCNVEQSFDDVRKYLCNEFSRIHRDHSTMAKIPSPWPEPSVLEELVRKSSGYFIYASTIIKFIGDENFRPTVRLEVIRNTNGPGSESAYDALDQLYLTILASACRQSELIPILCAIVNFQLAAGHIDQLFWARRRRNSDDKDNIVSYHASFLDFLDNPHRSGNFCVGTLNRRISLARSLLQFYAGPYQRTKRSLLSRLIDFIVSLPTSSAVAELVPLIGSMNPDYLFYPYQVEDRELASIAPWLKTHSAPADLIQLWEDYAFMFSIDKKKWLNKPPSVKHNILPSPELVRILLSMGFLNWPFWELPTKLNLTWTDLRATVCSLQPKSAGDERILPIHQPHSAFPWAARDLALQLIRKMVKNHIDTDGGANPSASHDAVFQWKSKEFICDLGGSYPEFQFVSIMPEDNFVYR
ncbi:NACHT domain-containing protein [Mycena sanguinolenta]|uniref:NACHT domain-containing protein n=1 Tax=Mycena sanguinolenta TaxID=230812 RepID=A0A8H6WRG3_9AGAR|nr:NACHT domain-containing protein [Mycena sanguinolenta]